MKSIFLIKECLLVLMFSYYTDTSSFRLEVLNEMPDVITFSFEYIDANKKVQQEIFSNISEGDRRSILLDQCQLKAVHWFKQLSSSSRYEASHFKVEELKLPRLSNNRDDFRLLFKLGHSGVYTWSLSGSSQASK
jgi:hypothetical protein